jgi:hypothetical protein
MSLSPLTSAAGRLARGGAAGLATGALAVLAHVEAKGSLPGPGLVLLPVLLLCAAAAALAGRERGPFEILALVGAGQLAMHVLMSLTVVRVHDHSAHPDDSGPLMVAAHVLATLVVVAVLAGAERALFGLTAALASVLPRKLCPAPVSTPPRIVPPTGPVPVPKAEVASRGQLARRGPPVPR